MAPFPHPAHRTGHADLPHPALGQELMLSRATPSAVSDQFSELIGFPISKVLPYCARLELRSLPSTGVTRLQRYYEPLRHPKAPSLSLAGFRLVIADHAMGLPVLRTFSCVHAVATTPAQRLGAPFALLTPPYQPSPKGLSGRPAHCPFRGLRSVHSRYGLHTRAVTYSLHANRRLQPLRYLHDCSDCFRLERLPGGACTHWKAPPLRGAHPKRTSRLATDARDILSLICRLCIFVARNVALSSCSVIPAWPPRSSRRAVGRLPSISISHFHGGPTMNGRDALKFGAAILVVVSAEIPASAQDRLEKRLDR